MRRIKILLLAAVLLLPAVVYSVEPDYGNIDDVLRTFQDSRLTRDLKNSGSTGAQKAFTKTLNEKVYKPADAETLKYVGGLPEYEGKRVITHDFRTPGADGASVNTDRDVRVLAEVEPDRWVEVPADKWKNIYYEEFAKRTGGTGENAAEHAEKFRQLATDKFHMEASHDYSDQNLKNKSDRIKVTGSVESVPNIVKVKAGEATLVNAESMSMMYFQKSWDQLSKADGAATDSDRKMHTAEGLAQMRKGVETLEQVRASYEKQGFDVGRLPDNFRQAADIIKSVQGTSATDVDAVLRNLQEHGFRSPNEFAENMRGQTESLKLAQKKVPDVPKVKLEAAGNIAGFAGDVMSISQKLKEAEQGSHLFWNFDKNDTDADRMMKTAAIAALELLPIPVMDALERGWDVNERAEKYMEYFRKELERGETDWRVHPAFVMFAATSTITAETISSMTIDQLISGAQAVSEGSKMVRDVSNNFLKDFEREKSIELQREGMSAARLRMAELNLGEIRAFRGGLNGMSLYNDAGYGETITFQTDRTDKWTDSYFVRWELKIPDGRTVVVKNNTSATAQDAGVLTFTIPDGMPSGAYSAIIRVFESDTLLQADMRDKQFRISDSAGIGNVTSYKNNFPESGGQLFNGKGKEGDILAFRALKNGVWNGYEVQWFVGGENYKTVPGADAKANLLRFDTKGMNLGKYDVSVRLIDVSGKVRRIADVQKVSFTLEPLKQETTPAKEEPKQAVVPIAPPAQTITPVASAPSVPTHPVQTTQTDYAALGRERWLKITDNILSNTVDSCYRTNAPQAYDKVRGVLLGANVNYDSIGRKTPPELSAFEKEQEKGVAQVIYNTISKGGFNKDCAVKTLGKLAAGGHITTAQYSSVKAKYEDKTVYWVVLEQNGSTSSGMFTSTYRASVVKGKTPPRTGFFNRNPASPSHYMKTVKAYGTLSAQEAQAVANAVNSGRGSSSFARTMSDNIGIKWSGNPDTPLITYGTGVQSAIR